MYMVCAGVSYNISLNQRESCLMIALPSTAEIREWFPTEVETIR